MTAMMTHGEPTTLRFAPLRRWGERRLSRAHVLLARRPELGRHAAEALGVATAAIGDEVDVALGVEARLGSGVVTPARALGRGAAFSILDCAPLGCRLVLELELSVLMAVLARLSGADGRPVPAARLTRIEESAFAYLCLLALSATRTNEYIEQRFAPRLFSVHGEREEALAQLDPRVRCVPVELAIDAGGVRGAGRLLVPAGPLVAVAEELPTVAPVGRPLPPELGAARVLAIPFLGRVALSRRDLESLAVGDVVVLDGTRTADGWVAGAGRLATRGFQLFGAFDVKGFQVSRAELRALPQESRMAVPTTEPYNPLPPLPIELEVELARIPISLSELAALRPGEVLPLHVSVSQPVLLRIGDRAVARAELVDIDGEVGARVLKLLP